MKYKVDYSLYLITDSQGKNFEKLLKEVEESIKGGVTLVQYREKNKNIEECRCEIKKLKELLDRYNIPLIINDYLELGLEFQVAGIHLGQRDTTLEEARKLIGENKIIGVSATTLEEALGAEKGGADYIGVGAIFPTNTKLDAKYVTLELLKEMRGKINIPIVVIGGINSETIPKILESAVDIQGYSLSSAILNSKNPKLESKKIMGIIKKEGCQND